MSIAYATSIRNNRLTQVTDAIDAGTGAGKLRIYDGSRPATGGTATTLLAELVCSDPVETSVTGGVLTFNSISDDVSADNTGTATWARLVDSDNNFVADLDVGTSGSDLNLDSTSVTAGQTVSVTSFTITEGNP